MKTFFVERLGDLPQHVQGAFAQAEVSSFDLSLPWFKNFIDTALTPKDEVRIFATEDDAGQVVVLPMCYDNASSGPKTIKSLVSFYTALYAPIGNGATNVELLSKTLSTLKYNTPVLDVIQFMPLDGMVDSFKTLKSALRVNGMVPFEYSCFGNWYLPVNGRSYADYYQTLPSRLKNTVKRKRNQFLSKGLGTLEIVTGGERLEAAIAAYEKVYATSWKVQEPFPDFVPGLIRLSAEQGWLRMGIAWLKDEPIAAQIWIVAHKRAAIFKLAYDESFGSYSAGSLLSAHLMEYVLDIDKVEEVDYLIGDDSYKEDWMSHRRERIGIIAFNPFTAWGLMGLIKQSFSSIKALLKSHSFSLARDHGLRLFWATNLKIHKSFVGSSSED